MAEKFKINEDGDLELTKTPAASVETMTRKEVEGKSRSPDQG